MLRALSIAAGAGAIGVAAWFGGSTVAAAAAAADPSPSAAARVPFAGGCCAGEGAGDSGLKSRDQGRPSAEH